jgi:glycerol kinase
MEELRANWAADRTWQPAMDEEVRRNLYAGWRKAVERTFNWVES